MGNLIIDPLPEVKGPVNFDGIPSRLVPEIQAQLDSGDSYRHIVAMGMLAKFRESQNAKEDVARLLAGEALPEPEEFVWARGLDADDIRHIELMCLVELEMLEEEIKQTLDSPNPTKVKWRKAVAHTFERREHLQCASDILWAASPKSVVFDYLVVLDNLGEQLTSKLPGIPESFDIEVVRSSISSNPDAWWVENAVRVLESLLK